MNGRHCWHNSDTTTSLLRVNSRPPHSHHLGSLVTISSAGVPLGVGGYGSGQDPTNTVGARWPNALFPFPGGGNDCPNTSTVDALFLSGVCPAGVRVGVGAVANGAGLWVHAVMSTCLCGAVVFTLQGLCVVWVCLGLADQHSQTTLVGSFAIFFVETSEIWILSHRNAAESPCC